MRENGGLVYIYNNRYDAYCNFKDVNGRVDVYFNREKPQAAPMSRENAYGIIKSLETEQPEITGDFEIRQD